MIRLKKKAEEKKETLTNPIDLSSPTSSSEVVDTDKTTTGGSDNLSTADSKEITPTMPTVVAERNGFKLFGIGGRNIQSGEAKTIVRNRTPGEIRIQKDITDLDGGVVTKVEFPNPNDLTKFHVRVTPDSGCWSGATYDFSFVVPALYPHEPPKVTCNTKIYHPNINLEGNVCLNILREEWKPVLDINAVIYGLIYLFYEPNPDDPLNSEAAKLYREDKEQFKRIVRRTLTGTSHAGQSFPKLI